MHESSEAKSRERGAESVEQRAESIEQGAKSIERADSSSPPPSALCPPPSALRSPLSAPAVSIILPTYNRAAFLPQAIQSIREQEFTDWELIIVDDGSTDETPQLIERLTADIRQPVRYIRQENQGAYGARNTGLDHAVGRYIAFFDSDDKWLTHHLKDCVDALEANREVDWVYGACRIVDDATGKVQAESTFYLNGRPRPFLNLKRRVAGRLRIIEDSNATQFAILHGLLNGLQNSVLRRDVFEELRFESETRNEAEDQLFAIGCIASGRKVAYFDSVHVDYRIHNANSSAAGSAHDLERQTRVLRTMVVGFERILMDRNWHAAERRALRRRLQQDYFWKLGYATLWAAGRRREALQMFRRGLRHWPWDLRYWKTYLFCLFRSVCR